MNVNVRAMLLGEADYGQHIDQETGTIFPKSVASSVINKVMRSNLNIFDMRVKERAAIGVVWDGKFPDPAEISDNIIAFGAEINDGGGKDVLVAPFLYSKTEITQSVIKIDDGFDLNFDKFPPPVVLQRVAALKLTNFNLVYVFENEPKQNLESLIEFLIKVKNLNR